MNWSLGRLIECPTLICYPSQTQWLNMFSWIYGIYVGFHCPAVPRATQRKKKNPDRQRSEQT